MQESNSRRSTGLSRAQMLMLGGMLFSMFFGAGNLILPPLLGLQAGTDAVFGMVGFLIAGIGLPVLGIIAVALVGDIRQLAGRVHPVFASVFIALVYLTIGPFLAIPRTSSTAYEMVKPLIPQGGDSLVVVTLFSVVFFCRGFRLGDSSRHAFSHSRQVLRPCAYRFDCARCRCSVIRGVGKHSCASGSV